MEKTPRFPRLKVEPLEINVGLRRLACDAIKHAITETDIYGTRGAIRLDERQLSQDLGVSRTPIREALTVLEQEGFVRSVPRRGIYVVRKTKREIVEMIMVWAAIESMAAGLASIRSAQEDLHQLREIFTEFGTDPATHITEYSQANMVFHKTIIRLGGCALMTDLTENLFIHMRAVREVTMRQDNRVQRSIVEHMNIISAMERRDAEAAERLVREHTLGLAAHIEKHGGFLDDLQQGFKSDDAPQMRVRRSGGGRSA
ncbi:MAG TPA: GntR family transcriptional regulator [Acetobacteraceae bacterium]|nr:GntR family transcriptional regulator [Acetobacteraceae bacterium]